MILRKYSHLLFDLDHTLWDFNSNCFQTLQELYQDYNIAQYHINLEDFYEAYLLINNEVWTKYDNNQMTKEQIRNYRFKKLFEKFGIDNPEMALNLEQEYLYKCPKRGILMPYASTLLNLLKDDFELVLITNGFQEPQTEKVHFSGLDRYFKQMFTSENTGYKKPDVRYFQTVLSSLAVLPSQCLVIGDNPHTDIRGAYDFGIDSFWVNSQNFPKTHYSTYYATDLEKLTRLI
jgi:putative hydrolase of the HAD superfamily